MNTIALRPTRQTLSQTIQSSFEAASSAARSISAECGRLRPDTKGLVDTMRLCMAEALNNIVEHAYEHDASHKIDIEVLLEADQFVITLTDTGNPMPNGCVPEVDLERAFEDEDLDLLPEGGFGLVVLMQELDDVRYSRRNGTNVLTMEKQFA